MAMHLVKAIKPCKITQNLPSLQPGLVQLLWHSDDGHLELRHVEPLLSEKCPCYEISFSQDRQCRSTYCNEHASGLLELHLKFLWVAQFASDIGLLCRQYSCRHGECNFCWPARPKLFRPFTAESRLINGLLDERSPLPLQPRGGKQHNPYNDKPDK